MFLAVEGVEGSGKSTFIRLFANNLQNAGISYIVTREPGGCPLGKDIRKLLLDVNRKLEARAELFLFLADRVQHVHEIIRPALSVGKWVLCDRYTDSTIAYQGYGRGMDLENLKFFCNIATDGLYPDKVILLDINAEKGLSRANKRNMAEGTETTEGRFEAEKLDFHQRIRAGFLEMARLDPERFIILDAEQPPEQLVQLACKTLGLAYKS